MPTSGDVLSQPKQAQSLAFAQSVSGCLSSKIGAHGLDEATLSAVLERAGSALGRLCDEYDARELPILRIGEETEDINAAKTALEALSVDAGCIVFFGTGGSGLGGQTLAQIAGWNIPGGGRSYSRGRPRTRFYDNLDALTHQGALEGVDLATTRFVVTSKSGGTTETLAQVMTALQAVEAAGLKDKIPQMFLGITEPAKDGQSNGLRQLLSSYGVPMLEHHTGIGGRFSCLTNVGLLPAMARGLDAQALRRGAQSVVLQMRAAKRPEEVPAALAAAIAVGLCETKGIANVVMMPYCDRLASLSKWFVQLWAESLGKQGHGTSPIGALGPLDQHSQLQLFMDGPRNHYLTILRLASAGTGPIIAPKLAKTANVDYLGGKTIGDIVDAQSHAIVTALGEAGRPVRTIDMADLSEETVGALLMHFMLETILTGYLLDIDPFDQPAVERAKVLTRQSLAGGDG
jgi:glucose-6-phosphate isomerase